MSSGIGNAQLETYQPVLVSIMFRSLDEFELVLVLTIQTCVGPGTNVGLYEYLKIS